jgi:DNA-binding response OmpR family regulator
MNETKAKILVVDDDLRLRQLLERYLSDQGFTVKAVPDAQGMDRALERELYDLIVLDLMLPGEDGLAICRRLRGATNPVAIIMLTAKGDEVDRIVGLEIGADDYLPKPFNPRELVARIHAVLRRQAVPPPPGAPAITEESVSFGKVTINLATRELEREGTGHPAHLRRIRPAARAAGTSAPADEPRQADGTRARPGIRGLRPRHRRADFAPAQAGRGRSRQAALHPDRLGFRLCFRS